MDQAGTHQIPTAQELVSAFARALRLSQHPAVLQRASRSTRKSFGRGERVKPATREEYLRGLGAALHDLHLLHPLANDAANGPSSDDSAMLIAGGLGQFAALWDQCVTDTVSFGGRSAEHPLAVLPLARLGLEDAGLRVACHARGRPSWILDAEPASTATALAAGTAYLATVRHLLAAYGLRRADLIDALPVDTVEGWEAATALPTNDSLLRTAEFFIAKANAPLGVHLDLRVSVALSEIWRWLKDASLPNVALQEMARGAVDWVRAMAQWSERAHETANDVASTVLHGARDEKTSRWMVCLASAMPEPRLAADLRALGGDWRARCRCDNGSLGDTVLAAEDARSHMSPDNPHRFLSDVELLAVQRCIPPVGRWQVGESTAESVLSPEQLEARGTGLLHEGHPNLAIPLLALSAQQQPRVAWPRVYLAQALEAVGHLVHAEVVVEDAMRLDPGLVDAHLVHASILLALGRPTDAIDTLAGVTERSEQPWVVRQPEAMAYVALGDWRRVEATAREGLRLNGEHAGLWTLLAVSLDQQGRQKEAMDAAKEAAHRGEEWIYNALLAQRPSRA